MHKFPRTPHIRGSRKQHGDHDLEAIPFEELAGKHLVVEEKCDGANCGISFSDQGDLLLQSRGHYLRGGPREKHFNLLKQWSSTRQDELFDVLGGRYVMYGEWLYAKHTCFYDALPHYFMEFDVYDTEDKVFLSTRARARTLTGTSKRCTLPVPGDFIVPVRVIAEGEFTRLAELEAMITRSAFITDDRTGNFLTACTDAGILGGGFGNKEIAEAMATGDFDPRMEGLYIKWEEDGIVKGRYKYVRDTFTNSILEQETHWHDRPIVQNKLLPGAFDRMLT